MIILKTAHLGLALAAMLFLTGCFVTSRQMPAGTGPISDEALVGDWRAVDADSGKDENVFIHIQKPDANQPLRVILVEDKEYHVYELRTTRVGARNVFSVKIIAPAESLKEGNDGSFLGYYEAKGADLRFYLLDANKVTAAIRAGKVQGRPGKEKYDFAELTGSPADLARFLASDDGWNTRVDEPALMKRLVAGSK